MWTFLGQREKVSLVVSSDCELDDHFLELKQRQIAAVEKIETFWKRHGRKMHLPEGINENCYIDDVKGETDCLETRGLYDMLIRAPKRWKLCDRLSGNSFRPFRGFDILSLLRITGKSIWKVELFSEERSRFPVYIKKKDEKTTFCVEFPFAVPLWSMPYTHVEIRVHGEEVEVVEAKGVLLRQRFRSCTDCAVHSLFYGSVSVSGGSCVFGLPTRETPKNVSDIL
nr:hypothetical protein [Marseillevirus cajuinensis]